MAERQSATEQLEEALLLVKTKLKRIETLLEEKLMELEKKKNELILMERNLKNTMTDYDIISKAYGKLNTQNALETDTIKVQPNLNDQETTVDSVNIAVPKSKTRKREGKKGKWK